MVTFLQNNVGVLEREIFFYFIGNNTTLTKASFLLELKSKQYGHFYISNYYLKLPKMKLAPNKFSYDDMQFFQSKWLILATSQKDR